MTFSPYIHIISNYYNVVSNSSSSPHNFSLYYKIKSSVASLYWRHVPCILGVPYYPCGLAILNDSVLITSFLNNSVIHADHFLDSLPFIRVPRARKPGCVAKRCHLNFGVPRINYFERPEPTAHHLVYLIDINGAF